MTIEELKYQKESEDTVEFKNKNNKPNERQWRN